MEFLGRREDMMMVSVRAETAGDPLMQFLRGAAQKMK